ncbi:glycosyltransferase [Lactiplantibacillus plantarum]|uniref:glycosyltransferase n=1 Tax=Lactiplantibacillus plantarum TaxID=1590 RepID=UPI0007BB65AE|nr:glycosyltransferase [Lactiplantibacillus plantarum]KZU20598.1 glycosyltransferase [Lactiplantibacillus plantarum]KZU22676.1 glycosyltransferase [Lactiplantibacillus plantarum]
MTKIACVIVTFNRKALLAEAIESVLTQPEAPEYVFVIDNASTDGTEAFIQQQFDFDDQHLVYVRCQQNLGGSAGFATGIRLALQTDCDWISISDDDAIFQDRCYYQMDTMMRCIVK